MNIKLIASLVIISVLPVSAGLFNQPTNQVTPQQTAPTGIHKLIVTEFYIPDSVVEEHHGILQRQGPVRSLFSDDSDSDNADSQHAKAVKASRLLAKVLVSKLNDNDDLQKIGVRAEPGSLPALATGTDTLVVDGAFLMVDEGGRLLQTGIGFGAGASKVEIESQLIDYSKNPPQQIFQVGSHSNPRRMPGAIVMLNPYVAAAKFVMSKNSSDKDVKKVAAGLAEVISDYLTGKDTKPQQ